MGRIQKRWLCQEIRCADLLLFTFDFRLTLLMKDSLLNCIMLYCCSSHLQVYLVVEQPFKDNCLNRGPDPNSSTNKNEWFCPFFEYPLPYF